MDGGAQRGPSLRDRLIAFAAVAAAVGSGLLLFQLSAAPRSYLIVNGAALVVVFGLMVPGNPLRSRFVAPAIAGLAIAVTLAALLFGPEVEGVRRWIALGPLRLHSGMLVIPALVAVLPRLRITTALLVTAMAATAIWAQPDLATALALFAGVSAAASSMAPRIVALAGLAFTALRPDRLDPVPLVETAVQDGWALSPLLGALLAVALALAVIMPAFQLTKRHSELRKPGLAVLAAMAAFALAPMVGAYPQPLIGYGASAILGYGLALAALRFMR